MLALTGAHPLAEQTDFLRIFTPVRFDPAAHINPPRSGNAERLRNVFRIQPAGQYKRFGAAKIGPAPVKSAPRAAIAAIDMAIEQQPSGIGIARFKLPQSGRRLRPQPGLT